MAHKDNFLFALILLATTTVAQTIAARTIPDMARQGIASQDVADHDLPRQAAIARCAYVQTDEVCVSRKTPSQTGSARVDDNMLAQLPRRMQGPPMGRVAYPGPWISQPSPGHTLVGALIGFGFGAAAGAKNGGVRGSLAVGTLVGLIGAGIGASIPSFPSYHRFRRGWPDDDQEASRSKPAQSRRASAGRFSQPDPPQPVADGENPPPAAETPQAEMP